MTVYSIQTVHEAILKIFLIPFSTLATFGLHLNIPVNPFWNIR